MDTNEAFDVLLDELRQALKNAQDAGTQAFQEGRFEEARVAAKRAEDLAAHIGQLESLRQEWSALVKEKSVKQRRKRLRKGEMTPQASYRLPILRALVELGGSAPVSAVLDRVYEMMAAELKEVDLELLSDGRSVRWRNAAQWERASMVNDGLLVSGSPRGIWEITEAGRAYLREHRAEFS
ncbi:MAG: winged helix-turn-helix domain-containing protein [Anaerolineae bacterium]|nr:winged helix-turn-helix domain-containing protein [Anaerolineae bacterium]